MRQRGARPTSAYHSLVIAKVHTRSLCERAAFLLASLDAVPFPVGARCVSRLSATASNMTLRRIFLLALAFVSSSAFIAVPPVRAPQLAGHCPKTLRSPAAPARVGNPKMVRIASGGERDAIEDAVRIFKDAVRAKEAGDLDEADALFTQATDLITAALDAARANGSVDDVDGLGFVLGTPTRPRGEYVEAITFAVFHCVVFVGTTALLTSPIFSVLSYPVLGGRPLYSELSVSDATIISELNVILRLSPLWFMVERNLYFAYDLGAILFLQDTYAREDKE